MRILRFLLTSLAILSAFALAPALAQSDPSEVVREIKDKSPKCVVFILDVSESMRVDDYNRKMRSAAEAILKEGLGEGDQVALFTFGSSYKKVFDEVPTTPAARRKLIEQLPLKPEPGEGTNIRQPHHEALKLAKASGKTPYIIILTDSFNDPPKNTPEAYTEYKKYYTPGKLDVYPATVENRDYESQLAWMTSSAGKTFGMGVDILPSGRPKEQFKVGTKDAPEATPAPQDNTPVSSGPPPQKEEFRSRFFWVWAVLR